MSQRLDPQYRNKSVVHGMTFILIMNYHGCPPVTYNSGIIIELRLSGAYGEGFLSKSKANLSLAALRVRAVSRRRSIDVRNILLFNVVLKT